MPKNSRRSRRKNNRSNRKYRSSRSLKNNRKVYRGGTSNYPITTTAATVAASALTGAACLGAACYAGGFEDKLLTMRARKNGTDFIDISNKLELESVKFENEMNILKEKYRGKLLRIDSEGSTMIINNWRKGFVDKVIRDYAENDFQSTNIAANGSNVDGDELFQGIIEALQRNRNTYNFLIPLFGPTHDLGGLFTHTQENMRFDVRPVNSTRRRRRHRRAAAAAAPAPPYPESSEWVYLDHEGNEAGPYSTEVMRNWYAENIDEPWWRDFQVRPADGTEYVPFSSIPDFTL
jgi:hypothetical protein